MGKVGFIGLGNIGAPIAVHLAEWPDGLVVCDRRPEAIQPFAERGATIAPSVADLASECDVISVMVLDDEQVRDVVNGLLPYARPGTVVAIHSTISVQTAVDTAAKAREYDVQVVDAPVSGGPMGAAEGRLAVMVGGEREAYERCKPVFANWAELILHVGGVGAGTRMKISRNLLTFVGYAAAAESQRIAEAAGLDLRKLAAVVRHSDALTGGASAIMFRETAAPLTADEDALREIFEHTYTLGAKDLRLALEMARDLGVAAPFTHLASEQLAAALGLRPGPVSLSDTE
jgi:3-hydroxyisobutyrate dehydrogenase-like beta-hydroxyacid dehydrogenase